MKITISNEIDKTISTLSALASDRAVIANIERVVQRVTEALKAGNRRPRVFRATNGRGPCQRPPQRPS